MTGEVSNQTMQTIGMNATGPQIPSYFGDARNSAEPVNIGVIITTDDQSKLRNSKIQSSKNSLNHSRTTVNLTKITSLSNPRTPIQQDLEIPQIHPQFVVKDFQNVFKLPDLEKPGSITERPLIYRSSNNNSVIFSKKKLSTNFERQNTKQLQHFIPNKQSRRVYDKIEQKTELLAETQLKASIEKRIEQRKKDSLKIQIRLQRAKQVEHQQNTEAHTPNDETFLPQRGSQSHRLSRIEPQNDAFTNAFKEVKTSFQKQREQIIQNNKLFQYQRACSQIQTPQDIFDDNISLAEEQERIKFDEKQSFEQSLRRQNSARARKVKAIMIREQMERKRVKKVEQENAPPDLTGDIAEKVKPLLKKKFNVFSYKTQRLFTESSEFGFNDSIAKSLGYDQNMLEKSQLFQNYFKYFNERITTREELENDVENIIQKIFEDVEDVNMGCLAPMIKFVDLFTGIESTSSVKRDVAKYRKEIKSQSQQVYDPRSLRGAIEKLKKSHEPIHFEENEQKQEELLDGKVDLTKMDFTQDPKYKHLFNQEGFIFDFLQGFYETQKAFSLKIKSLAESSSESPKALSLKISAITFHCLYFIKNVLSVRLRLLFNILENEKMIDRETQNKKKEEESQLEILDLKHQIQSLEQQLVSKKDSFYSLNTAVFEANRDKDDYLAQINEMIKVIGDLRERNQNLQSELKDTKEHLKIQAKKFLNQINDNSDHEDDLHASCGTDYEQDKDSKGNQIMPRGEEAISNMSMSLAALLRQIQSQRVVSLDVKEKLKTLVESSVNQTQKEVDIEQQQIFSKLMQAVDKGKQKYIIRQEFEMIRDKMQIYVSQASQTDTVKVESPKESGQPILELKMFDNNSNESKEMNNDKEKSDVYKIPSKRTSLDLALRQLKVYGMNLMKQSAESPDGLVTELNSHDLQKIFKQVSIPEEEQKIEEELEASDKDEDSDQKPEKSVAEKSDQIRQKMQEFLMREEKSNKKGKINLVQIQQHSKLSLTQDKNINKGVFEPQIGLMTKEKQSIIDQMKSQHEQGLGSNIKVMSKDKLFNVIDELLARKLVSLLKSQQAFKGYQDPNKIVPDEKVNTLATLDDAKVDQTEVFGGMLEFTFQHYLESYGLRSGVIKQLMSLAAGLKKYYSGDNDKNYFAKYLYYLFNFEVSEPLIEQTSKVKELILDDRTQFSENNIISISFDPFKGFYDTKSEQIDLKAKQRFSEEQVSIVVWSRHVFLYAEQAFLQQSIDKVTEVMSAPNADLANIVTVGQLELTQRRQKLSYYLRNGGQIHLSFLLQTLRQAFLGDEYKDNHKVLPKKYVEMQNQFLEMVANIQLEDLTIFDIKNPDMAQQHKKIYDFSKNYQLLTEAKFILFKFFAIIRYARIDLEQLVFQPHTNSSQTQDQQIKNNNDSETSVMWGNKKINFKQEEEEQRFLDMDLLILIINQKVNTEKKEENSKPSSKVQSKRKIALDKENQGVFSKSQIGVLVNYLARYGFVDARKIPIDGFKELMDQVMNQKQYLEEIVSDENDLENSRQEDELFLISFTQFSKVCLDQWKRNLQRQVLQLKKIFIEADLDGDGVLTFEEFWLILKQMEERQKLAIRMMEDRRASPSKSAQKKANINDSINSHNNSSMILEQMRARIENTVKDKKLDKKEALALFNEALEMSIQEKGLEVEGQDIDQITPLAFTKMILKNQIGGFGSGTVFSDLRYTLSDSKFYA